MAIMAAHGVNDARNAARLLAATAKECLAEPALAPSNKIALNNVYRLLEAYRDNPFFGMEWSPEPDATEAISSLPPSESHLDDLKIIVDASIGTVFRDEPADRAISAIENVLRWVTYPAKFSRPENADADERKAAEFFTDFLRRLAI